MSGSDGVGKMVCKLTAMEYKFMEYIWKHTEGVFSYEIYEAFPQALGTKSVFLHRLKEKGFVEMRQIGKQTFYVAVVSKQYYDKIIMEQKIKKNLGVDSIETLLATLCGRRKLSQKQADKLNQLIEELKEDE